MAGEIQKLNLAKLKEKIHNYNMSVSDLIQTEAEINQNITLLKKYWTGKRMNVIIDKYNSLRKNIYEEMYFFSNTVMQVLINMYNNYAKAEKVPVIDEVCYDKAKLEEATKQIATTNTNIVKFEKDIAEKKINKIYKNAGFMTDDLNILLTQLDELVGYSDALKTLVEKYKQSASQTVKDLNGLSTTISQVVENAHKVVTNAEKYSEQDATRVKRKQ